MERRSQEAEAAYDASPFSLFTEDYFLRLSRDPDATPKADEIVLTEDWGIAVAGGASPVVERMAAHLREFLAERMQLTLTVVRESPESHIASKAIYLTDKGGGTTDVEESYTIEIDGASVRVLGRDAAGARDGVVRLVDLIGFRQAPFLQQGRQTYTPRLRTRMGMHGSLKQSVFMGCNTVSVMPKWGDSMYKLSKSDALPELAERRDPELLEAVIENANRAQEYGLKTFIDVESRQKFAEDDPIFEAHPGIRGARTWVADGEFTLCTEDPLVKRYWQETVEGVFRDTPGLDGMIAIFGGEGFYHCFMRPYGVEKGHTNCPRCEKLGAETVVSNLCNYIVEAARRVNPDAELYAWLYSADQVWSKDRAQIEFMSKLKPGVSVIGEVAKDEVYRKPGGIVKTNYDYSIDFIGPGERAKVQLAASSQLGVPVYLLGMMEGSFEASLLPHIPCLQRWASRAEAMAGSGAEGVYNVRWPYCGSTAAEVFKYFFVDPHPPADVVIAQLAGRVGGPDAGPAVARAWRYVSDAIPYTPIIDSYFKGPHYLGPAHPMFADTDQELPDVFYGYYLFLIEAKDDLASKGLPTTVRSPEEIRGYGPNTVPMFERYYRTMEEHLARAVQELDQARPLVPARCAVYFDAEYYPMKWLYHTARTEANFFESCPIRDELRELAKKGPLSEAERSHAAELLNRWRFVLEDELENARGAVPVLEADVRLDSWHRGDHSFNHMIDMLNEKIQMTERDLREVLPSVAAELGVRE
jgi:hypothetical protein